MTTIATFTTPEDAHLFRMFLESQGINGFLLDEHFVQLFWYYSNTIGGVRVGADDADSEAAGDVYKSYMAELRAGPYPLNPVRAWPVVLLMSLLVGVPFILFGRHPHRDPAEINHDVGKNAPRLKKLLATLLAFAVSGFAIPITRSIINPMVRRIALSGPGEPDFSLPNLISKVGLSIAVIFYLSASALAVAYIRSIPRCHRSLACFLTAVVLAGIPYQLMTNTGPCNAAGDGGPNFMPLFVIAGGVVFAIPFLFWSLVCLVPVTDN